MDLLRYILPIIALSLIIAFHELGHLIMARLAGIKVNVFSLGIGKKLVSIKKKGTEYAISAIPLGGYCKLKGGDPENPVLDSDSMDSASSLKKILIYAAGPIFNIILAMLFLATIYLMPIHKETPATVIPITDRNLPAETAGILKGDRIISINGVSVNTFDDISTAIGKNSNTLDLTVIRNDEHIEIEIIPETVDDRVIIGIYPYIPLVILDADKNNTLKPGDRIIAVDNTTVDDYISLSTNIGEKEQFQLQFKRDGKDLQVNYTIKEFNNLSFRSSKKYNLFEALKNGTSDTFSMLYKIAGLLSDLFKTKDGAKNISSPFRLVYDMGNSIQNIYAGSNLLFTIQMFLTMIASISLTLGFINILPIPILDGGKILLYIATMIKRSPFKPSIIYGYQTVGLIIVLLLFILGIGNDFTYFWRS